MYPSSWSLAAAIRRSLVSCNDSLGSGPRDARVVDCSVKLDRVRRIRSELTPFGRPLKTQEKFLNAVRVK